MELILNNTLSLGRVNKYKCMDKQLQAQLNQKITVVVGVDVDFNKNWIESASIIEHLKARTFLEIKNKLHEKIATLSLNDIDFEII